MARMSADSFHTQCRAWRLDRTVSGLAWAGTFQQNQGQRIDGDRYKTTARKTPEETTSTSNMMLTMFPT
jgi:hypothetical protein